MPNSGWKAGFIVPVVIMVIFAIIYIFLAKDSPKKIGLKEYVDPDAKRHEQDLELQKLIAERGKLFPYIYLFKKWRFDLWLLIIAGSSIARYGLLTWIPTYYVQEFNYDIKKGAEHGTAASGNGLRDADYSVDFRQVFLNQSAADGDYLRGGLRRDGILLYESGTGGAGGSAFVYRWIFHLCH